MLKICVECMWAYATTFIFYTLQVGVWRSLRLNYQYTFLCYVFRIHKILGLIMKAGIIQISFSITLPCFSIQSQILCNHKWINAAPGAECL